MYGSGRLGGAPSSFVFLRLFSEGYVEAENASVNYKTLCPLQHGRASIILFNFGRASAFLQ
eukprot:5426466-Amphidinium_carterae.2